MPHALYNRTFQACEHFPSERHVHAKGYIQHASPSPSFWAFALGWGGLALELIAHAVEAINFEDVFEFVSVFLLYLLLRLLFLCLLCLLHCND